MSADNGIYIAQFPDADFRVIHAQAIDNIDYVPEQKCLKSKLPKDFTFEFGNPSEIVRYFNTPQMGEAEAKNKAYEMYKEIMESDFAILEYGICFLTFKKPYSWYETEAKRQPEYLWD